MHFPGWAPRLGRIEARRREVSRPLQLVDRLLALAALAVSLSLWLHLEKTITDRQFKGRSYWPSHAHGLILVHQRLVACLVPLTLGYPAIRLRGRRPPTPRMARHPGFVAATVATAVIMLSWGLSFVRLTLGYAERRGWCPWPYDFYPSVGYAVLGSWLSLIFTGRWHRDRLWAEVPGLVLGFAWIGTALVEWAGLALQLDVYRW